MSLFSWIACEKPDRLVAAWDDAIAREEQRAAELREATLALLYVRARQQADLERTRGELHDGMLETAALRARDRRAALVAFGRLGRLRRRAAEQDQALVETTAQADRAAAELREAQRLLADLRTERARAVAVRAHDRARQVDGPGDTDLDRARDEVARLRAEVGLFPV